jgi:hypothetical protein
MLGPPLLPRNLEASFRDLDSAKADVRAATISDVVRHARGDETIRERAVRELAKRLQDDHPKVRAAAAVGLGDLHANDAVTALLVTAFDDDAFVRQMALNALGEIGDARALPRLRRALSDERPEVRYQTIIAFARIADRAEEIDASEVDDILFAALDDADPAIVHIALRVAEERLDEGRPPDSRLVARARALVADDPEISPHVRLVAAILLVKAGDDRGKDIVMRVVRGERIGNEAPDKEDERAAVELAGQLGREALPHLERRAYGAMRFVKDTCAFHARIALARLGHERAKREILNELGSTRREVLEAAIVSAGRARLVEAKDAIARLTSAVADPELTREALTRLS